MKRFCFLLFLCCAQYSIGQIRVSNPIKDLGDVFENSGRVKTTFNLTNPYRVDTIKILDIETSCGCTAVLVKDTIILPGKTIELEVNYDPANRLGLFVKSIKISTLTGKDERNMLYLKIMGNVVAENFSVQKVERELIEYKVAPIYFYPITGFDTSYLDFTFINDFINDLTYEIDFYQFTTVGIEVMVPNHSNIEYLENLIEYVKEKVYREFLRRGFSKRQVFFENPVFKISEEIPSWAMAEIRLHSSKFDFKEGESSIKVTSSEKIQQSKMLLDYQRFALPEVEEILQEVNFESIEGKLFLNGSLALRGMVLMPWKKSDKLRASMAKDLEKAIQKAIKKSTGASKKEVSIQIDSLGVHPQEKYRFVLWDIADIEKEGQIKYIVQPEKIKPPLLPTYKQMGKSGWKIEENAPEFIHFWENLVKNAKLGYKIELLIESSLSHLGIDFEMTNKELASLHGNETGKFLANKFKQETGRDLIFKVETLLHGPNFDSKRNFADDFDVYNYLNIIPIVHQRPDSLLKAAKPYMVNFDYYFKGIDVGALGFQRFAEYLAAEVQHAGFVKLRIESSISKVPVEKDIPNLHLAYSRLEESIKRLREEMARKLVDPNRILIVDERTIEQGPAYDGSKPILAYKQFHYIRIIPEKALK